MKPKELHRTLDRDEVEKHRFHDCPRYDDCLTMAALEQWESFSCMLCREFMPKKVK